jgi:DNA-directed RNA polymerase subunit RPC12/RpoP
MILDATLITVKCARCKRTFKESIALLKTSPKIPCPGCGVIIKVDGSQLATLQTEVDAKLVEIHGLVKRINRRSKSRL